MCAIQVDQPSGVDVQTPSGLSGQGLLKRIVSIETAQSIKWVIWVVCFAVSYRESRSRHQILTIRAISPKFPVETVDTKHSVGFSNFGCGSSRRKTRKTDQRVTWFLFLLAKVACEPCHEIATSFRPRHAAASGVRRTLRGCVGLPSECGRPDIAVGLLSEGRPAILPCRN